MNTLNAIIEECLLLVLTQQYQFSTNKGSHIPIDQMAAKFACRFLKVQKTEKLYSESSFDVPLFYFDYFFTFVLSHKELKRR